ncbi:Yip1 family protein [Flavobacterium sandaracinum]|uniref:YIP1 family protein n=1 Tax=Flavobacterium sandaracinum TaxID=2541733 RepID=A0A4R5CUL4_9FLAO|nr:Yip1 family protein [Flavobacterium sandaracinum]TDE03337.1 YIP1 family protein [Flavobacterium sandaracinum]
MNETEQPSERIKIAEKELFLKLMTAPRTAFQFINEYKYEKHLYILLFLAGIVRTFDRASAKNMGDNFSLWNIIAVCVIFGGIFGWISYYLYAALISWTGSWLNGKGNTQSIVRVLAYAFFPSIFILILLIPQLALYGNQLFQSDSDLYNLASTESVILYLLLFVQSGLGIWSLVLCIIGIAEVQQLSIGKAILNVLFPVIVLIFAILVLVLIFKIFE